MCGLVGILKQPGTKIKYIENVFNDLLYTHALRGQDSAGVALVLRNSQGQDKLLVHKKAMLPTDYLFSPGYRRFVYPRLEDASLIMGHTRSATHSKDNLTDENAHPFTVGHITLSHNGNIQNNGALIPTIMRPCIDSVAAAFVLSQVEPDREHEALAKLEGPFALTWYNEKDQTFNIARNDGRELVVAFVKNHNAIVYASEVYLLHACMERNGWHPDGKYRIVPAYSIFKHQINDPQGGTKRIPFAEPQSPKQSSSRESSVTNLGHFRQDTSTVHRESLGSTENGPTMRKTSASDRGWLQPSDEELDTLRRRIKAISGKYVQLSNFPTSAKKLRNLAIRMASKGQRLGSSKFVIPISFALHKNQRVLGEITGTFRGDHSGHMVAIAGVTEADFDEAAKKGYVMATLVNLKNRFGRPCWILLLDDLIVAARKKIEAEKTKPIECCRTIEDCCTSGVCKAEGNQEEIIVNGPRGSRLNLSKYLGLTQAGCLLCGQDLPVKTANEIVWRGDSPICLACATDPQVKEDFQIGNDKAIH